MPRRPHGSTPYVVNSAEKNGDAPLASFDLAFGKNETRMNGGYIGAALRSH